MQEGVSALQQQLFNLLYSYAADHFQQRKFDLANRFFSAAYMYAEQGNKAKTARIMAVCNIGMKTLDRYSLHLSGLLAAFSMFPFVSLDAMGCRQLLQLSREACLSRAASRS